MLLGFLGAHFEVERGKLAHNCLQLLQILNELFIKLSLYENDEELSKFKRSPVKVDW